MLRRRSLHALLLSLATYDRMKVLVFVHLCTRITADVIQLKQELSAKGVQASLCTRLCMSRMPLSLS